MFVFGAVFEIAADEHWNQENRESKYEKILWNGYDLYVENLKHRYEVELVRDRKERIAAIAQYLRL